MGGKGPGKSHHCVMLFQNINFSQSLYEKKKKKKAASSFLDSKMLNLEIFVFKLEVGDGNQKPSHIFILKVKPTQFSHFFSWFLFFQEKNLYLYLGMSFEFSPKFVLNTNQIVSCFTKCFETYLISFAPQTHPCN